MKERTDDGQMAALGIADSSNVQVAIAKAKLAARKNLAQLVSLKINNFWNSGHLKI